MQIKSIFLYQKYLNDNLLFDFNDKNNTKIFYANIINKMVSSLSLS